MASSAVVHDPRWPGSHDRLVSVCSALAVDLSGQVASEDGAGHVVSGVGELGAAVTLPRHCVDLVVTEHGVADLRGRSLAERAEALRAVAAPEHRGDL